MSTSPMTEVIHRLRRTVLRDGSEGTDAELLDRFVRDRDEAALATLVERHAGMVWGVCQRLLPSHHDAEDAFQATFLVLVRKAASVQRRELIASWLYGVAQQIAVRVRSASYKHQSRERQVSEMPEPAMRERDVWDSLQPLLDEELSRLPEKYRSLLLLCDIEGKTRKEAAQELKCPEGTIAGRLARARAMLAKRLERRGIIASAALVGTLLAANAASAAPPTVMTTTIQAALLYAAGHATAGVISANAVALSEGVLKAMLLTKLKVTAAFLFILGALAIGGGTIAHRALADSPDTALVAIQNDAVQVPAAIEVEVTAQEQPRQRPQPKDGISITGKIVSLDVAKNAVTVGTARRGEATMTKTYAVAKDAKILRDGREVKLADLRSAMQVTLKLSADEKEVTSLSVTSPAFNAPLKSVDATKNTITITNTMRGGVKEDKTYNVAKDARIMIDGKESRLADLKEGAVVSYILDANAVTLIRTATTPRKERKQDE